MKRQQEYPQCLVAASCLAEKKLTLGPTAHDLEK
ncbi:hypothetical protein VULLAG_LOCUS9659 [Vulpes lagopus]